jgi:protein-tyrosine phosphatase
MNALTRNTLAVALAVVSLLPLGCGSSGTSSPSALNSVQVVQDALNNYTFTWAPPAKSPATVQVFGGSSPDSIGTSNSLGTAVGGTVLTVSSLDTTHRWYFDVEQPDGTPTTVAARHVTFSGPVNFRDLGGYPTADGRHTKWGVFFRSDQLSSLTTTDATYLVNSRITHDVDLRTDQEIAAAPDIPATDVRFTYTREQMSVPEMGAQAILTSGVVFDETVMAAAYEHTLTTYATAFAGVFQTLAAQGPGSVFHCVYGKDRTGMVAALLLMAANVPDSVIVTDYSLTDQYEAVGEAASAAQATAAFGPTAAALFGVSYYSPPAVMQKVLTYIRQTYGSAGAYLQTGGLDPATLAKVVSEFVQ